MSKIVERTTTKLDGDFLVLDVYQYDDGECRVEVVFQPSGTSDSPCNTTIMVQRRSSLELAVAAIARDFTTFATRALATLPTVGQLVESYDDDDDNDEEILK